MAEIQVNEQWRISSYSHGWSAQKAKQGKNRETGESEVQWEGRYFYTTFDAAVTGLANALVRESGATDIEGLKRDAEEIAELLEGLRPEKAGLRCE